MTKGQGQEDIPNADGAGSGPPPVRPLFNHAAHSGVEVEVKRLVREGYSSFIPVPIGQNLSSFDPASSPSNDNPSPSVSQKPQLVPAVFHNIVQALSSYIIKEDQKELFTRQIEIIDPETLEFLLMKEGRSLRIRGEGLGGGQVGTADVCVKTEKSKENSGALVRGEFEAPIDNFEDPDLNLIFTALEQHYPRDEHPDLYKVLDDLDPSLLKEAGRISCFRRRALVELPPSETGIAAYTPDGQPKRFVAEVMFDDNLFYIDNRLIPGLESPIILRQDFENEFEVYTHACEYDQDPDKHLHVSQNLTPEDKEKGRLALIRMIDKAGGPDIVENNVSKAHRLLKAVSGIFNYFRMPRNEPGTHHSIQSAFELVTQPVLRWPRENTPKEVIAERARMSFPSLRAA